MLRGRKKTSTFKKVLLLALVLILIFYVSMLVSVSEIVSPLNFALKDSPNEFSKSNAEKFRVVHHVKETEDLLRRDESENWGRLYRPLRILCGVPIVLPDSFHRIERIERTWGKRCDILLWTIAKDQLDLVPDDFPSIGEILVVNTTRPSEGSKRNVWEKVHLMWAAIGEHYINKAEWFLKVDDDSFLFTQNLKRFVQFYNPMVPHYLGHTLTFRWSENIVFNSGIGYALSKAAVQRLAPTLRSMPVWSPQMSGNRDRCMDRDGAGSDTSMAICLKSVGVVPDNTLDELNRERFLTFQRESHREFGRKNDDSWYWRWKSRDIGEFDDCCSDEVIVAHGYKGKESKIDTMFDQYEREEMSKSITGEGLRVPPLPQWFLYAKDIPFKIDEFRNVIEPSPPRDAEPPFQGWQVK